MPRFLLALVALLVAAPVLAQPVVPGSRVDGVAAVVGDQVVLYSEVDALAQQAATTQSVPVTDDLWSRALDQLVDRRVLIDAARRDTTLSVTEDQITREVDRQVAQLAEQTGGEDALAVAYGRSLDELRASFRTDTRDELTLQQFRSRRLRGITVTPGEVRDWFATIPPEERTTVPELVRVAHVVKIPRPSEGARSQARAFTQVLRDSIVAGQATIEALADRYTQDPGNAARNGTKNGGLYTQLGLRDLDPTFATATAALEPGTYSQVFESSFGYHVVRLNSRSGDRVSFNHILITVPAAGTESGAALAELAMLRDSIVTHEVPFEAVARRHSDDPYSATRGGFVSDPQTGQRDLRLDALGARWRATVDTMAVGEISRPADITLLDNTPAVHFVLLQKRTPPHPLALETDYALLSEYALNEKRSRMVYEMLGRLRPAAYVDVRAARYTPATPPPN